MKLWAQAPCQPMPQTLIMTYEFEFREKGGRITIER